MFALNSIWARHELGVLWTDTACMLNLGKEATYRIHQSFMAGIFLDIQLGIQRGTNTRSMGVGDGERLYAHGWINNWWIVEYVEIWVESGQPKCQTGGSTLYRASRVLQFLEGDKSKENSWRKLPRRNPVVTRRVTCVGILPFSRGRRLRVLSSEKKAPAIRTCQREELNILLHPPPRSHFEARRGALAFLFTTMIRSLERSEGNVSCVEYPLSTQDKLDWFNVAPGISGKVQKLGKWCGPMRAGRHASVDRASFGPVQQACIPALTVLVVIEKVETREILSKPTVGLWQKKSTWSSTLDPILQSVALRKKCATPGSDNLSKRNFGDRVDAFK
ncbi:hypothetical protein DFH06DRAFT_1140629 [Mycena polygramma]|nr:hypothetical protein DFH06DRAFT_1140629 [Mycena polygramma]